MKKWSDNTVMPFGKWQGKELIDIPDDYFKWFWNENIIWYNSQKEAIKKNYAIIWNQYSSYRYALMDYIENNFDATELKLNS